MHYKNGQPAKAGDLVIQQELYGTEPNVVGAELVGVLTGANPGSTTCNGTVTPLARRVKSALGWGHWVHVAASTDFTVTLSNCLPANFDDIGTPPPPGGGPGGGGS